MLESTVNMALVLCFLLSLNWTFGHSTASALRLQQLEGPDSSNVSTSKLLQSSPPPTLHSSEHILKWSNQTLSVPLPSWSATAGKSMQTAKALHRLRRDARDKSWRTRDRTTEQDGIFVQTKSGMLHGLHKETLGIGVDVFFGVPFAKPPLGDLRFRKPVKIDPWPGIYNAHHLPNSCQQEVTNTFPGFRGEEMWNPNTNISEDCLYLNIWVPSKFRLKEGSRARDEKKGATVLIWIYGGGYMSGTSTLEVYDGLTLAAYNDVIVASINYRLGAFGFLYLNTEEAPGNQGLFDQAMAIEWIKDNIAAFGGDPNSLTLFGESAGAGAVSVHLLSPVTRPLTQRAILQSGTVDAPWGFLTAEESKSIAQTLIANVGCGTGSPSDNIPKVMECMRRVDAGNISTEQWKSYSVILGVPSAPTIDGVFLPKHPDDLLKEGDFRNTTILIGTNQDEGTYFVLYDFIEYFKKDDTGSSLERNKFIEIINTIFKSLSDLERKAIIFQYTDWNDVDNSFNNQKMIGDVAGDYYFTCPTNNFAMKCAEHQMTVYYYHFTQRSSISPWGQWMGVVHADELDYVFGHPLNVSGQYTESEKELSRRIMNHFVTFAKTGKPVSDDTYWPFYSRRDPQYFILNAENRGIGRGPRASACAFWNELMPLLHQGGTIVQLDRFTVAAASIIGALTSILYIF